MPRKEGLRLPGLRARLDEAVHRTAGGNWAAFARKAGVVYSSLTSLAAKEGEPGIVMALRICAAAERPLSWLLGEEGPAIDMAVEETSRIAEPASAGMATPGKTGGVFTTNPAQVDLLACWGNLTLDQQAVVLGHAQALARLNELEGARASPEAQRAEGGEPQDGAVRKAAGMRR